MNVRLDGVTKQYGGTTAILHEGRVHAHGSFELLRQKEGDDLEALLQKLQ